jgi:hypothetical protein
VVTELVLVPAAAERKVVWVVVGEEVVAVAVHEPLTVKEMVSPAD